MSQYIVSVESSSYSLFNIDLLFASIFVSGIEAKRLRTISHRLNLIITDCHKDAFEFGSLLLLYLFLCFRSPDV